jgi:hypothetical protein
LGINNEPIENHEKNQYPRYSWHVVKYNMTQKYPPYFS